MWIDRLMCARSHQIILGMKRRVNWLEIDMKWKNFREKMILVLFLISWIVFYQFK
ncbi:hypothetical protein PHJA_000180700 [Phtheirospermum japonicum]|uniref:Uncharacterized protein n=1 Tax=Phtheirospermum japonicum TaxID=374723 RepID=A0A830B784_9LAMI|nr:hypothetical protein PHJA_000180700 [Phtheirospermum japonicum]